MNALLLSFAALLAVSAAIELGDETPCAAAEDCYKSRETLEWNKLNMKGNIRFGQFGCQCINKTCSMEGIIASDTHWANCLYCGEYCGDTARFYAYLEQKQSTSNDENEGGDSETTEGDKYGETISCSDHPECYKTREPLEWNNLNERGQIRFGIFGCQCINQTCQMEATYEADNMWTQCVYCGSNCRKTVNFYQFLKQKAKTARDQDGEPSSPAEGGVVGAVEAAEPAPKATRAPLRIRDEEETRRIRRRR